MFTMEASESWFLLGHPRSAIPILEKGHSEWLDNSQMRDYALCVSRLAAAYAAAGELGQACAAAEKTVALARGLATAPSALIDTRLHSFNASRRLQQGI